MRHVLPDGLVIQAHVLDALASLPAESVQMCVTSPPYFGLRSYSGEQRTIWGGDKNCEHEWGNEAKAESKKLQWATDTEAKKKRAGQTFGGGFSAYCQRCGAWYGAYGLEDSPARWAEHTLEWLRAVKRVLRKDGTVWLNVGSSYAGSWGDYSGEKRPINENTWDRQAYSTNKERPPNSRPMSGYKPLDLIDPFALLYPGLLADGWYVRSVVIWAKPNPMPESVAGWRWERCKVKTKGYIPGNGKYGNRENGKVTLPYGNNGATVVSAQWADCPGCPKCAPNDGLVLRRGSWRPTSSYEYVIMLAKSASYYADGEGVREPHKEPWRGQGEQEHNDFAWGENRDSQPFTRLYNPAGRNLRDVWELPTQPYSGAHFATYPEELVKRCILASTPDAGVCAVCSAPWARVVEQHVIDSGKSAKRGTDRDDNDHRETWGEIHGYRADTTLGWRPTCAHSEATPATILDCFGGSGTSAVVARSLGRRFVLCELSGDYVQMALRRLMLTQPAMAGLV